MATATTTPAAPTPSTPAPAGPAATFPAHRLTVERVERMLAAGVFTEKDPVFLWKGRLVETMTKGRLHSIALARLMKFLVLHAPEGYFVEPEVPLALGDDSLPEPDLKVVRGDPGDYRPGNHPTPADVSLVVEVSDSSLAIDSGELLQAYALGGVAAYWVVNVPGRTIDVYEGPSGPAAGGTPGYASSRRYEAGESVPLTLDGREVGRVAVADILP